MSSWVLLTVGLAVGALGMAGVVGPGRRDRVQRSLFGPGWRTRLTGVLVGVVAAALALVVQAVAPSWLLLVVVGAFVCGVTVWVGVVDAGILTSWLATALPLVLSGLAAAGRGCNDTPGAAAACRAPPPRTTVVLGWLGISLAASVVGYLLGRGTVALPRAA